MKWLFIKPFDIDGKMIFAEIRSMLEILVDSLGFIWYSLILQCNVSFLKLLTSERTDGLIDGQFSYDSTQ